MLTPVSVSTFFDCLCTTVSGSHLWKCRLSYGNETLPPGRTMNEGNTKTDSEYFADTSQPVGSVASVVNPLFSLRDDLPPEPPEGFELLEEIGRGGMGLIYRAKDLAFDRDVALKFLQKKYNADSLHSMRFVEEARITGQLQHPGIPPVHQVGKLPDGRPYLVMKLIKGYSLNELLWGKNPKPTDDTKVLPHVIPKNYLAIFEAICQAVGYAHAHQVIHRDLKPHNIMVGAFGEVQVMDWGLAKLLKTGEALKESVSDDPNATRAYLEKSQIHTSGSDLTTAGSVLGTPSYMPPEQAVGANSQLDARSDVFGLGAILCAMLTGKPPFQGEGSEATRLQSALGLLGEAYDRLDACGAESDLIKLAKRCLAAKREDRPENGVAVAREMAQLRTAADERARQAELDRTKAEVQANEHRHRRKVMLIAGVALISVLLVGIVGTTWGLIQAGIKESEAIESANKERQANQQAQDQKNIAEAKESETSKVLEFVKDKIISAARPEGLEQGLGRDVKLRDAMLASISTISKEFENKPLIEARIRMTIGQSFHYLGDRAVAQEQLERAYQIYLKHAGIENEQTLLSLLGLANVHDHNDQYQKALDQRLQAYEIAVRKFGVEHHVTQMAMNNLGASYHRMNRYDDALTLSEEVLKLAQAKFPASNAFTMLCMANLAYEYATMGKVDQSLQLFDETLRLQTAHLGPTHPNTLDTKSNLAMTLVQLMQQEKALPLFKEILEGRTVKQGEDHPSTLQSMRQLAYCYNSQGQYDQAAIVLKKSLPLHEKRFGNSDTRTLECLWMLIATLFDGKQSNEAMPLIDACLWRNGGRIHQGMLNAMYILRFRHNKEVKRLDDCTITLKMWEFRAPKINTDPLDLGRSWAFMASLVKEKNAGQGQEQADRAMAYLEKAQAAGWNDVKELEGHSDFSSLRSRDDYRMLLAKMKLAETKPSTGK